MSKARENFPWAFYGCGKLKESLLCFTKKERGGSHVVIIIKVLNWTSWLICSFVDAIKKLFVNKMGKGWGCKKKKLFKLSKAKIYLDGKLI